MEVLVLNQYVLVRKILKAQEEELDAYEAKRAKMKEEYNHCITFIDDPLPITKFSYRVNNSTKEATMRITRNNQPLNLIVYDKFMLKKFGFSKWLELHTLAIKEVFVKENIVVDGMHKNLVPPEEVVGSNGLMIREPKIFMYNDNFNLVFQREEEFHLATTAQLIRVPYAIKIDYIEAREMFDKMVYVIEARNNVVEVRKIRQDNLVMRC
ncbi:hypothetical protein Tco_0834825 [Tanacetum coccineum]